MISNDSVTNSVEPHRIQEFALLAAATDSPTPSSDPHIQYIVSHERPQDCKRITLNIKIILNRNIQSLMVHGM